jgi:hypothetical protein
MKEHRRRFTNRVATAFGGDNRWKRRGEKLFDEQRNYFDVASATSASVSASMPERFPRSCGAR